METIHPPTEDGAAIRGWAVEEHSCVFLNFSNSFVWQVDLELDLCFHYVRRVFKKLDGKQHRCHPSPPHNLSKSTVWVQMRQVNACLAACVHMSLWKYCPSPYLSPAICVSVCAHARICICMYESRVCRPFYYLNGPRQHWAGTNHTDLLW